MTYLSPIFEWSYRNTWPQCKRCREERESAPHTIPRAHRGWCKLVPTLWIRRLDSPLSVATSRGERPDTSFIIVLDIICKKKENRFLCAIRLKRISIHVDWKGKRAIKSMKQHYHSCTNAATCCHSQNIENGWADNGPNTDVTFGNERTNDVHEKLRTACGPSHKCGTNDVVRHIQTFKQIFNKNKNVSFWLWFDWDWEKECSFWILLVHIFSTAGTKYLSQTTASAKNKYKLTNMWKAIAPACLCSSVKISSGKSSMAGWVQFWPK